MVSEDLVEHDRILYAWSTFGNSWSFKGHEVGVKGRVTVNSPDGVYRGGTWHWDRPAPVRTRDPILNEGGIEHVLRRGNWAASV
jgi:hypothetical protein